MGIQMRILKQLKSNETTANFLKLFTGSVMAQAIPFAFEPFLTRLYTPSEFAVLALFISFSNLFAVIATGRYELAIMLPSTNKKAIDLVALSLIICLAVTLLTLVIVIVFNSNIGSLLNNNSVRPFLYFVPLMVLFTGIYQTANYWLSRNKQFSGVATSRVVQTISGSSLSLAAGFFRAGALGLIASYLLGLFFSFVTLLSSVKRNDYKLVVKTRRSDLVKAARVYKDFPRINTLHAFTDILQQSLLIFLLSYFFNETVVGSYSRTFRLMAAPASLIGAALGQVYFQQASRLYANGESIAGLTRRMMKNLTVVSLLGFGFVFFTGEDLFAFILGSDWRVAGSYASTISPWLMLNLVISPVSSIPLITGFQKTAFYLSLIGNSWILIGTFWGAQVFHDPLRGFQIVSGGMVLYYLFLIRWMLRISNKTLGEEKK